MNQRERATIRGTVQRILRCIFFHTDGVPTNIWRCRRRSKGHKLDNESPVGQGGEAQDDIVFIAQSKEKPGTSGEPNCPTGSCRNYICLSCYFFNLSQFLHIELRLSTTFPKTLFAMAPPSCRHISSSAIPGRPSHPSHWRRFNNTKKVVRRVSNY